MTLKILSFLIVILVTWFILDRNCYSPRAQIKMLWKEVHKLSELIYGTRSGYVPDCIKEKRTKLGKFINSLLDYYFDSEEDREYREENRYSDAVIEYEENIKRQVNRLLIQDEDWKRIEKLLNK